MSSRNCYRDDGQKLYECPVCIQLLLDPRLLPCGHSVCHTCCIELNKTTFLCPVCRRHVAMSSIDCLPINFGLKDLVQQYSDKVRSNHFVCTGCTRRFCCSECWSCQNCDGKILCGGCSIRTHQNHCLKEVSELVQAKEAELSEWREEFNKRNKTILKKFNEIKANRVRLLNASKRLFHQTFHDQFLHKLDDQAFSLQLEQNKYIENTKKISPAGMVAEAFSTSANSATDNNENQYLTTNNIDECFESLMLSQQKLIAAQRDGLDALRLCGFTLTELCNKNLYQFSVLDSNNSRRLNNSNTTTVVTTAHYPNHLQQMSNVHVRRGMPFGRPIDRLLYGSFRVRSNSASEETNFDQQQSTENVSDDVEEANEINEFNDIETNLHNVQVPLSSSTVPYHYRTHVPSIFGRSDQLYSTIERRMHSNSNNHRDRHGFLTDRTENSSSIDNSNVEPINNHVSSYFYRIPRFQHHHHHQQQQQQQQHSDDSTSNDLETTASTTIADTVSSTNGAFRDYIRHECPRRYRINFQNYPTYQCHPRRYGNHVPCVLPRLSRLSSGPNNDVATTLDSDEDDDEEEEQQQQQPEVNNDNDTTVPLTVDVGQQHSSSHQNDDDDDDVVVVVERQTNDDNSIQTTPLINITVDNNNNNDEDDDDDGGDNQSSIVDQNQTTQSTC